MKFLVSIFVCLFCCNVVVTYASATDDISETTTEEIVSEETVAKVAERVTCADIKSKLSELEINDENKDEIEKLKSDYRRFCTPKAAKRRASDSSAIMYAKSAGIKAASLSIELDEKKDSESQENEEKKPVAIAVATEEVEVKEPDVTVESDVVDGDVVNDLEPMDTRTPEEIQLEKELENLAAGLCADGTKPNRFGCCTDEIFKDLGDLVFACCPKDGGDCYEPIEEDVSER